MIETDRLLLKPLTPKQLMQFAANNGTLEEELGLKISTRIISSDLKDALEKTIISNLSEQGNNYLYSTIWTAILKVENVIVGDLCFYGEPSKQGQIEIGYETYPEFQKKGYMTEMLSGIIKWASEQPIVKSIIASTDIGNVSSHKVLKKNNFIKIDENTATYKWKLNVN